ncbi:MAG: PEP/pyruvate-binding domain-containing protein [Bacillota bacterium]
MNDNWISSGLKSIDDIIKGLRRGDNVVWQIDNITNLQKYTEAFVDNSIENNVKTIYMRFAEHQPLIDPDKEEVITYSLKPVGDFESFTTKIYNIITREGENAHYVFDSLSELLTSWATDLMIANFFQIICPYLYELDTVAYFAISRKTHSQKTISTIRKTTQVFLNLYYFDKNYFIHPIKVSDRYSTTMFLPHVYRQQKFVPITDSLNITRLFSGVFQKKNETYSQKLDYWDELFLKAQDLINNNSASVEEKEELFNKICQYMLTRNKKMLSLLKKHMTLSDLINIKSRLIGTGFIGGKALGMLLARKILNNKETFSENLLEAHDSFYIGSDVFYTYIVYNGWWKLRIKQKNETNYYKIAAELKEKLLQGKFPDRIKENFRKMLNYFGQSPIIVRSSSLLEDSFGNAFAGKYESYFCINQGNPDQRLENFLQAVRKVYASSMSKDALVYREERELDQKDEQMALLIQGVSGRFYHNYYYPQIAGVGNSYNNYAWNNKTNPEAGLLRLVMGLGTRAVNRTDNDYPRIVALDRVMMKIYNKKDEKKYTQHYIDLLNLSANKKETIPISKLMGSKARPEQNYMKLIGRKDREANRKLRKLNVEENKEVWIINFDNLLKSTEFPAILKQILYILEDEYSSPVDIEFTLNFTENNNFKINLLQCRPLQTNFETTKKKSLSTHNISSKKLLFSGKNTFMGGSFHQNIYNIIYVKPESYQKLKSAEKYTTARNIGKINQYLKKKKRSSTLLIGPGRWGTSTPSLGVPINFSEISNISILIEVAFGEMTPELSYGSHFFQDLIEASIKYIALNPDNINCFFRKENILNKKNFLKDLSTNLKKQEKIIHLLELDKTTLNYLKVDTDINSAKFLAYFK